MLRCFLVSAAVVAMSLQLADTSCTGSPCQIASHCRSKWGWCGTASSYCNAESSWTAACDSPSTTASPKTSGFLSSTTTTSTTVTTQPVVGSCAGEPCLVPSLCRSEWGFCGSSTAHCNAESTWTSACNGQHRTTTSSTTTQTSSDTMPQANTTTITVANVTLCTGSGWTVHWASGSPPECLDWKAIADVWKQAAGNASNACDAVVLAPGEAEPCTSGPGVKVHSVGHTPDPTTGEVALGIWQALPSWYLQDGQYARNAFPDIPANFSLELAADPCKQAYITERIRDAHCFKPWDNDGPIEGAPSFCNSGWTGNLPPSRGGATQPGQPLYYTNNEKYNAMVQANGLSTCQ